MAPTSIGQAPSLSTFINKSLKQNDIETSIELLISLLKRRQIKNSRPCAIATAELFLRIVGAERIKDAQKLIDRIRDVGRRLAAAQPREMAVGNVVRRILGVVREVAEDEEDEQESESDLSNSQTFTTVDEPARPQLNSSISTFSPLNQGVVLPSAMQMRPGSSQDTSPPSGGAGDTVRRPQMPTMTSYAGQGPQPSSLLSFLETPLGKSPYSTPPSIAHSPRISPSHKSPDSKTDVTEKKVDIKGEVINGIQDLIEELEVVDAQIAESALDHIHSNEIILTHTSSQTVQKFLSTAARKRKFTVIHAEAFPNDHTSTHATIVNGARSHDPEADERWKPLTAMGITVILIPDTAVFALMSRINKVILAPHTVLANGSLLAAAGAATIASAAHAHHVPVVVLSGVYKLSPVYPFDTHELIEYGDPGKVVPFEDGEFMDKVDVVNPVYDWVEAENVDLYITNLGGCAPSFLYRIVADHYRAEDIEL